MTGGRPIPDVGFRYAAHGSGYLRQPAKRQIPHPVGRLFPPATAMIDKRKAQRLLGETMRDIGILVLVFAPLDAFFQRERPGWFPLAVLIASGLLFIALGIMLEAKT